MSDDAVPRINLRGLSAELRFFLKIEGDAGFNKCWDWRGVRDREGYGFFTPNYRNSHSPVRAHRWSWEHFNGELPDGLVLDHLCRNKSCVNPWHLDPVTPYENTRRARWANGRCQRGHDMSLPGAFKYRKNDRTCRTCLREGQRANYLRRMSA